MAWAEVRRSGGRIEISLHALAQAHIAETMVVDSLSVWALCGSGAEALSSTPDANLSAGFHRSYALPDDCEGDRVRVTWHVRVVDPSGQGEDLVDWSFDDEIELGLAKSVVVEPGGVADDAP
jgi:hypothetical protein